MSGVHSKKYNTVHNTQYKVHSIKYTVLDDFWWKKYLDDSKNCWGLLKGLFRLDATFPVMHLDSVFH